MAVRRAKRWRKKYTVEEASKRAKKLLPVMYPQMEFQLTIWDELEQDLFPKFEELGIPAEEYDFYMAWAKRKASMGLQFSAGTRSAEATLLYNEFVTRGLDPDNLDVLELVVDDWIDTQWGIVGLFLYVGLEWANPDYDKGGVVKVDVTAWNKISTLIFDVGEEYVEAETVYGNYLYAGLRTAPAKIVKVDLTTFSKVSTLTLDSGENYVFDLVNDGVYIYVALATYPAKIVKISLATFEKVATLTLNSGENDARALALTEDYLYVGLGSLYAVGKIAKIRLSDFTREAVLTLETNDEMPYSVTVKDTFLYAGLRMVSGQPARVVKVNLSTFTKIGTYTVDSTTNALVWDLHTSDNFLYVSVQDPHRIKKVNLTDMSIVGYVDVEASPSKFLIYEGILYCAFVSDPAKICKIDLSTFSSATYLTFDTYDYIGNCIAISTVG